MRGLEISQVRNLKETISHNKLRSQKSCVKGELDINQLCSCLLPKFVAAHDLTLDLSGLG